LACIPIGEPGKKIDDVLAYWRDRQSSAFAGAVIEPRNDLEASYVRLLQNVSQLDIQISDHAQNCEDHIQVIAATLSDLEHLQENCRRLTENARFMAANASNQANSISKNAQHLKGQIVALGNPPSI